MYDGMCKMDLIDSRNCTHIAFKRQFQHWTCNWKEEDGRWTKREREREENKLEDRRMFNHRMNGIRDESVEGHQLKDHMMEERSDFLCSDGPSIKSEIGRHLE